MVTILVTGTGGRGVQVKPSVLVMAVTEYCLVCTKPESCWACIFRSYLPDVLLELERRRLGKVVSLSEGRERLFRSVAPDAVGVA